jgi:hypothetical protein
MQSTKPDCLVPRRAKYFDEAPSVPRLSVAGSMT